MVRGDGADDAAAGNGSGGRERVRPLRSTDPAAVGGYTLKGLLGVGGMGKVYLGEAPGGRLVAIKIVRPDLAVDDRFARMFQREAELARRVAQFCTAEVIEVGEDDGRPFLVTEFVDGPTLWDAVLRGGPLPRAQLERIAIAVATALTAIHGAGMIHRDLKPSNVMLSPGGPLVIDFGIARALDTTTQLTGSPSGTPSFMAPEQARGEQVTQAADIFAWGGIVVYAATGRPPFGSGRAEAVLYRVVHGRPALDGVPEPLLGIVAAAMSPNPEDRPTAQQLYARLLTGVTAGQPAPARLSAGTSPSAPATTVVSTFPDVPAPAGPPPISPARPAAAAAAAGAAGAGGAGGGPGGTGGTGGQSAQPDGTVVARPGPLPPPGDGPGPDARDRRSGRLPARLTRQLRQPKIAVPIAVAVVAAIGLPAAFLSNRADRPRGRAEIVAELTAEAARISADQPILARKLALAAHTIAPSHETRLRLAGAGAAAGGALRTVIADSGGDDQRHRVNKLAFLGSRELFATVTDTGATQLWPVVPESARTAGGGGPIRDPVAALANPVDPVDPVDPVNPPEIVDVASGRSGSLLATADMAGRATLWDVSDPVGEAASRAPRMVALHGRAIHDLTFDGNSSRLATVGADGTAKLWDVATANLIATLRSDPGDVPRDVGFSPEGSKVVTAGSGDVALVWASDGTLLAALAGNTGSISDLAFNRSGTLLATAGDDHAVRLWDLADVPRDGSVPSLFPIAELRGHTDAVVELVFGGDNGAILATASADGTARLWDVGPNIQARATAPNATDQPLLIHQPRAVLTGHAKALTDLSFGPGGALATASEDGTARLWDVTTGAALATFATASGVVRDLAFDADGTVLATAGGNTTAQLWDLDADRLVATACAAGVPDGELTEQEWTARIPELAYESVCD